MWHEMHENAVFIGQSGAEGWVITCTSYAFGITHELSLNFASRLKNKFYDIFDISIIVHGFQNNICSVEYGSRITLPVFHCFLPYHPAI